MKTLEIARSMGFPWRGCVARDSVRSDAVRRFRSLGVPPMSLRGKMPMLRETTQSKDIP
jgi:hypothetical protein